MSLDSLARTAYNEDHEAFRQPRPHGLGDIGHRISFAVVVQTKT